MDYHEILLQLTTVDGTRNEEIKDFDEQLQQVLQKIQSILTKDDKKFIIDNIEEEDELLDIGYQYIYTIVHVLQNIKICNSTNNESLFSVKQFHTLKVCIKLITAIGIIPCLLPGVGIDITKLCSRTLLICGKNLTDLQKYRRLQFTVNSLIQLYDEIIFRPVIIAQIGPLLAALLQLSYAPLMKPSKNTTLILKENRSNKFIMTADLYDKLKKDQEHFTCLLHQLLNNCPLSTSMKELMVILGSEGAPKWLQRETRKYLVQQLMKSNGVVSIIAAVCEDILDLGEHWNKLGIISKLIATSHGNTPDKYYKSICPQLLNLLASTQIKYSTTIGNCCITALYEYNPTVCLTDIVGVICSPLLVKNKEEMSKSEYEVEKCIETLTKCFITVEAKFKQLPCQLLMNIAVPLFSLYNNVRQSVCILKTKIKQLILLLLYEESSRNDLFAAFLGHNLTNKFGYHLKSIFGPTGGIEIIGIDNANKYEEFADSLFDLTFNTAVLSTKLFSYLLQFLSHLLKLDYQKEVGNLLETEDDIVKMLEKQLLAVKLLSNLANICAVQEAQIENPKSIICFIKSLFNQYLRKIQNLPEEDDCEILYVSLMLVKMILSDSTKPLDWTTFSDFIEFLKQCCFVSNMPSQLLLLTRELIELIETQDKSKRKHYEDLSVECKPAKKFEEALKDLADPLLPVRAHGLIVLTKLIENKDPCVIARKMFFLQIFKENLKHEDSFIYLTAINGLCALTSSYPQMVIEMLVQEYIDMPQRIAAREITVETRIKLGEILVKVTKNLGEMAFAYKAILINGFLCATRDSDALVRASSLSCLGELCKILSFRLGDIVIEVLYCISCIIKTDKNAECRRAAVMVSTLLLRGLGKDTLFNLGKDLIDLYHGLKYLRDNDEDPVLRLHVQLTLEELDLIVRDFLFSPPKLEKRIFLLDS
ncbi:PREDICTED: transport and Golgi organization protein 6 homolog [Eufriesea mexicana]|uniref:transport and Golgi organization protein 6 homolog n=1 Tax=Eufriesea mexicana TaxID=516756 RepID=UPI00083C1465|nr:PREDICTED: transport and Golgi organization protein 6 homolog [Eufriesea mexicana]